MRINIRKALALVALTASLTACDRGHDITGPSATTPSDTAKKGNPIPGLPTPPTKTCSNDPKTGEPCVNGTAWSWSGVLDIPDSIPGTIVSVARGGDNMIYLNMGNTVLQVTRTMDAATRKVTYAILPTTIALSTANRPILYCGGKLYSPLGANGIHEIDLTTRQPVRTLNLQETMTRSYITSLSCFQNGQSLVIGDSARTTFVYNLAGNTFSKFVDTTSTGGAAIYTAVNPAGNKFVVGGAIKADGATNAITGGRLTSYPVVLVDPFGATNRMYYPVLASRNEQTAVAYGNLAASAAADSTIRLYDPQTLANGQFKEACVKQTSAQVSKLATSPDGVNFAGGLANGNFAIWRRGPSPVCDQMFRSDAPVTNGAITSIFFTQDGQLEISSGRRLITFVADK